MLCLKRILLNCGFRKMNCRGLEIQSVIQTFVMVLTFFFSEIYRTNKMNYEWDGLYHGDYD